MEYILTEQQFAFMQRYHEIIEYSMFSHLIGGHCLIDAITSWPEWKALFRDMGWDNAYDRYEDTPGYDRSFKSMLRAWLEENPALILSVNRQRQTLLLTTSILIVKTLL